MVDSTTKNTNQDNHMEWEYCGLLCEIDFRNGRMLVTLSYERQQEPVHRESYPNYTDRDVENLRRRLTQDGWLLESEDHRTSHIYPDPTLYYRYKRLIADHT